MTSHNRISVIESVGPYASVGRICLEKKNFGAWTWITASFGRIASLVFLIANLWTYQYLSPCDLELNINDFGYNSISGHKAITRRNLIFNFAHVYALLHLHKTLRFKRSVRPSRSWFNYGLFYLPLDLFLIMFRLCCGSWTSVCSDSCVILIWPSFSSSKSYFAFLSFFSKCFVSKFPVSSRSFVGLRFVALRHRAMLASGGNFSEIKSRRTQTLFA